MHIDLVYCANSFSTTVLPPRRQHFSAFYYSNSNAGKLSVVLNWGYILDTVQYTGHGTCKVYVAASCLMYIHVIIVCIHLTAQSAEGNVFCDSFFFV